MDLACRLSPENLACDGEASSSYIKKELRDIRKEWKALEKRVGFKVSENDIWKLENQRWKEHGPRKRMD